MHASSEPEAAPPAGHAGITRLAPSPTGALHLGNARTFVLNWVLARRRGWKIILRIEDLDTPRNKPGAVEQAIEDLRWLGVDWDEGPLIQSDDLHLHEDAMRALAARGLVYPCALTRTEIEAAASAPQEGAESHEVRFPASLRPPLTTRAFDDPQTNWRFAVPEETVRIDDEFTGPREFRPCDTVGDFVVWTKRAQPAYQLAVVVDDHGQCVTHVVRGDDLLESAARQSLLYRALGLSPVPHWCHLPLIVGEDGRRLAKRHGDSRLTRYRSLGVRPQRVLGLLAWWSGIRDAGQTSPRESDRTELLNRFDLATMPRTPVVFRQEDEAWLLARS